MNTEARENAWEQITIGFGPTSDWLRIHAAGVRLFVCLFFPKSGCSKAKPKQTQMSF